jgi:hypothetical protein
MKKFFLILFAASFLSFETFAQLPSTPLKQVEFSPEQFNAHCDGATDDGPAFQACIDAMPARGGVMHLSAKTYLINTVINITKPIHIVGMGADNSMGADSSNGFSNAPTKLLNTNGTSSIFDIQAAAVTVEKIAFEHSGTTPISGCYGIYVSAGVGTPTFPYPSGFKIYDCSFAKFYDNIHVKNGFEYWIQNCYIMGAKNANVYVDDVSLCDAGDATITGCLIYGRGTDTTKYGVYHHCSGGLRLVNNKFNAWIKTAYYSDIAVNTVSRIINANSFENYESAAIVFTGDPATDFQGDALIEITGNQFAHYGLDGLDSGYHIIARDVNGFIVSGNQFNGTNTQAIFVDHSQNVTIGENQYEGMSGIKHVTITNSSFEAPTLDRTTLGIVDGQGDRYDNITIMNSTGVPTVRLGSHVPFPSYGTLYFGGVTPDGTNYTLAGDGADSYFKGSNSVNLRVASTDIVAATSTGIKLPGSSYLNFGATAGSSGYGFRDNAGTPQFKISGGAWTDFGSGAGGSTTFAGLTDVSLTSPANNDIAVYNGTAWLNKTPAQIRAILGVSSGTPTLQTVTDAGTNYTTNDIGLKTTTAATNILAQSSPSLIQTGNYWNTTSSVSDSVRFRTIINPINGVNGSGSEWHLQGAVGNAGWSDRLIVPVSGTVQVPAAFSTSGTTNLNNATFRIGDVTYLNGWIAGANTNQTIMKNSTAPPAWTPNAGQNYTTMYWYGTSIQEASSGVHHLVSNMMINRNSLVNGTATTDYGATVYIDGSMTGQAPTSGNYAMWIDSGETRLDGPINLDGSVGTSGQVLTSAGPGAVPTWTTVSGGGSGVTTMAAIGSTPNANGASISGSTLTLQPADASFGGVVTTGAQTFEGTKTFNQNILSNGSGVFSGEVQATYGSFGELGTTPITPSGRGIFWSKSDGTPHYLNDAGTDIQLGSGGGSGTVTSVGLSTPSWLTVAGSPVTTTGTLAVTATTGQTANQFLATPNGSTGAVSLRSIVAADIPTLNQNTTGTASGSLIGVQFLTTGTTYTPTSGTTKAVIILVGGGGGGGGASGAASSVGAAGGGGGGSLAVKYINNISGTYTYAIGAAGTAGANTGGNGGAGGSTTFANGATTITAPGGAGGIGQTAGTSQVFVLGGAGGAVSTNGDINGGGSPGIRAYRVSGTLGESGTGGDSEYGGAGQGLTAAGAGNAATGFGAGGGGALSTANTNRAGGAGAPGVIIVYEYK